MLNIPKDYAQDDMLIDYGHKWVQGIISAK
jgi:hypothetical protein